MRVVAIIQARMSSSRLPGKTLMDLAGKPVIWHVFHRLAKSRTIDEIVLATSTDPTDDPLADYARSQGVRVVRGPLDDVLARYVAAARETGADVVVRVTGDAPLVDPEMLDPLVDALIESDADYATLDRETIHKGVEPFTASALFRVNDIGREDPASVEHVTPLMKTRRDLFRVAYVAPDPDVVIEGVRVSVDTLADLRFLTELYARLGAQAGEIDVRDAVRLLRAEPSLLEINSHVRQKGAQELTRRVLFRCDGGSATGLGHVRRCLAVAEELVERHGWGASFALQGDENAASLIRDRGHRIRVEPEDSDQTRWLEAQIEHYRPDALVMDTRSAVAADAVAHWSSEGIVTAVLDDASDRRLSADLAFYPPVPQVGRFDWSRALGRRLVGWEWVVLDPSFARTCSGDSARDRLLVSCGGSDPFGVTMKAVRAARAIGSALRVTAVVGPAFRDINGLVVEIGAVLPGAQVVTAPDMPALMSSSAIAISTFGVTAYELAACGVPAVLVPLDADHAESASAFVEAGIALRTELAGTLGSDELAELAGSLLHDEPQRALMSRTARGLVDGRGAARVARILSDYVNAT